MATNDYSSLFQEAGKTYNVDPELLRAVVQVESGGNPTAVSEKNAQGLGQIIPSTAKALGVKNPFDPRESVFGAAKLLDENLTRYGNPNDAILAYHGGTDQKNWGPKTRAYLEKVTSAYQGTQGSKMPSSVNTIGETGSGNDDAFSAYFSAKSAPAPAQGNDPFSAYFGNAAQPAPVKTAAVVPAQAQQPQQIPAQGQPVPGGFTMGVGDVVKGGVQSLVHGIGALAERYPNAAKTLNFLTGGDLNADVAGDFSRGAKQVDTQIAQQERAYQAQRAAAQPPTLSGLITGERQSPGIDWARGAGNVLGAAPLALLTPSGAGASLAGRAALGAGAGAFGTLATPVTDDSRPYAEQKKEQLALGTALGGAAPLVTAGLGSAVRGVTDPVRQRLAEAGVTMTPGQILGGALQRTEDKLTSIPVLGDFIKNAQRRSLESFNRATYNSALEPLGQTLPDNVATGANAITHVRHVIGDVYNSIQPRATFVADQNFAADLAAVRNELAQNAPGALAQFDNIVQNQITAKLRNNAMNGDQWGNTRSAITSIARDRVIGNATPDDRVLSTALNDLGDAVNAAVGRASPQDILPTLNRANAAWAQYKQIERAAGSVGASNNANVFTAAQFANAVRRGSTNAQKATNSGLNAQLAGDAADVLGSKYPDSGTVGRSLMTLGTAGLAGHTVAPGVVLPAAAAIGLGSLPYTATGQRLAQALLMNRPAGAQAAGNAIANIGPRLGALLAPSALLKP